MYSIKHELFIFRISNNNKNKQTNKQKTKTKKTKTKQKKNRTEPIYRTKILRLPHAHTHYKHTHTRMHRRRNKKRAKNQLTSRPDKCTNNNGQACKLCSINICELHVNESGLLLCAICIVTIIHEKRKESTTRDYYVRGMCLDRRFCRFTATIKLQRKFK